MNADREVTTIVVGFGFSCVPLLREMDRTGEDYLLISEKIPNPIWANLKRNNRLDFDLVSSYYTSFYSFDLVNDFKKDVYTTAKEFHDMHLSYYEKYKDKILTDEVKSIENYDGYSIVKTASGTTYRATNVVVSTGFRRKIHDSLNGFDYETTGKTIVFNSIGDSSNLMIAKLIAKKNRIICLGNGFTALDKMFKVKEKTVTLDQIEYHNIAFLFPSLYRAMISGHSVFPLMHLASNFKHTAIGRTLYRFFLGIGKLMSPHLFAFAYPQTVRPLQADLKRMRKAMPFPNGIIAIKYWPVDGYSKFFGDDLAASIKAGYLLNDLPMFIDQGLVEYWDKKDTIVDHDLKQIRNRVTGATAAFGHFVDGGPESPRLPPILVNNSKCTSESERQFKYMYRENYFGVVPKKLSNVFFIGYTRPTTGGLANMTEMQGLLVHKLIADPSFKSAVYGSIDERLEDYNSKYYYTDAPTLTDHLVFYGFYTEEIARAIGINVGLKDCSSLRDVSKYLFFPNNAFKYRQKGEYKVEGCDRLVDSIDRAHQGWSGLKLRLLTFGLYHVIICTSLLLLYMKDSINLPAFIAALVVQYALSFLAVTPTVSSQLFVAVPYSYLRFASLFLGLVAIIAFGPVWTLPVIGLDFLWTYLVRKIKPESARLTFNDLKIKRKYKPFLQKYLETYRSVFPLRQPD